MTTLFAPAHPRHRWTGTTALALRDNDACTVCGRSYSEIHTQPALFYHGGYGEASQRHVYWCSCGALNRVDTVPVDPRHLDALVISH
jgi:hypothetical protein